MDFRDTAEQAAFRAEVREFVRRKLPSDLRASDETILGIGTGEDERDRDWLRTLATRGWVAPAWPKQYGGAGLSVLDQFIFNEELARARAPRPNVLAIALAGPTIIVHGNDEQKAEHLPGILSGEVYWCQGFSEPGSGSDLASLQTTAVRDGDDFIIHGTKVWTSGAHRAQRMMLLARTNPDQPKHRGISYFLLDMKTPGIEIRPLVNLAGIATFNQVFFNDVRVPAKDLLGDLDRGWYVATTTLDFERSAITNGVEQEILVEDIAVAARERLGRLPASVRAELADRAIEARVGIFLSYRVISMQARGLVPNHEASINKLYTTELSQRSVRTAMRVLGLEGLLGPESVGSIAGGRFGLLYLLALASTIAGGTSEVQRLIIATRGLGLPRAD
jgi:alkylation response protein AidB-like acyl-CoA dehydrogenase